ncbi:hypothetical protein [Burkholderia sp. Bp8963]|uniref:hypothetical protein n=1 Tax=Burkholderia sp. Bp8963 TaxID=2184547 RepID=UPI0021AB7736|nr:hypothetical protein [Burkholderia sp. Bp8963]
MDTNQIYTWLGGIAKPALAKWVDICSTVQILPRDLLQLEPFTPPEGRVRASQRRHEPTELGAKLQATLASQPNPSLWIACGRDTATYQTARRLFPNLVHQYSEKQRRYREDQMERCEKFLNMALASDDLIGASDVAKQTGVDVQTLRRFFPAKTVELGRLYVEKKKQLCLSRIESLRLKIRDGINRVDGAGLEISRQNIAVALGLQRHERLSGEMLELIREESYAHVAGDAVRRSNERFLRGKGYSRIVKDEG